MKNLNRIGKIKILVLFLLALPNLFLGTPQQPIEISIFSFFPLVFAAFAIPFLSFVTSTISGQPITNPSWNDNPFNTKKRLSFFQFAAYFFIAIGLSMIIGAAIRSQGFNSFGLMSVNFGIGILIGIRLTTTLNSRRK